MTDAPTWEQLRRAARRVDRDWRRGLSQSRVAVLKPLKRALALLQSRTPPGPEVDAETWGLCLGILDGDDLRAYLEATLAPDAVRAAVAASQRWVERNGTDFGVMWRTLDPAEVAVRASEPAAAPPGPFGLPATATEFLAAGRSLDYDPSGVECGRVTLRALSDLALTSASKDAGGGTIALVELVASCEGYDPDGILVWYPTLERFGYYDPDHAEAYHFEVDWPRIEADPAAYLAAQWDSFSVYPRRID